MCQVFAELTISRDYSEDKENGSLRNSIANNGSILTCSHEIQQNEISIRKWLNVINPFELDTETQSWRALLGKLKWYDSIEMVMQMYWCKS